MQHPTRTFLSQPFFASLNRWNKKGPMGAQEETLMKMACNVKTTVGMLDAAGLEVGLISAWHGPQGFLISNDEVAEFSKKSNGRLIGVGTVDIREPLNAVKEIRRCVNELGFKGIRVLPWLWETPPTDRLFYPVYAACEELGVPLCLQVGHTGPLKPSEYGRPIPYVDQMALDFPTLKIVCGHIGYPWTQEMIAVATKHQNVYIDTSAYTVDRYPEEIKKYIVSKSGRKKVMFGSNYPMIPPQKCLKNVDSMFEGLPEAEAKEAKGLFMKGNAERVFRLVLKKGKL